MQTHTHTRTASLTHAYRQSLSHTHTHSHTDTHTVATRHVVIKHPAACFSLETEQWSGERPSVGLPGVRGGGGGGGSVCEARAMRPSQCWRCVHTFCPHFRHGKTKVCLSPKCAYSMRRMCLKTNGWFINYAPVESR